MKRRHTLAATLAVALTAALAWTLIPATASAFPNAAFHMQDKGMRGVDTLAAQHLLTGAGHEVEANGVFDDATEAATEAFQEAQGLTVDGIVGPKTWEALTPDLATGDSGPAVTALRAQLNAKQRLSLPAEGDFDAELAEAVTAFQDHAGIDATGTVTEDTWRNLVWHFDFPDFETGTLCNQDPDGNGEADWGTASAVGQLEAGAAAFAESGNGPLPVGDLGFEHGGDIPGHGSHDVGLDADVWPIRTDDAQCDGDRITWRDAEYDREATRQLAEDLRAAAPGHVVLIFFNDPELIAAGLTTEYPNHDNHLHIRYCEVGGGYEC